MLFLDYNNNMKEIFTYKISNGKCPYDDWFYELDKSTQTEDIKMAKKYLDDLIERNK